MAIKQLTVFVENKQGALVSITETLAAHNVNIRALSIADTRDFGILRLIVSDTDKAVDVLRKENCIVSSPLYIIASVLCEDGFFSSIDKFVL